MLHHIADAAGALATWWSALAPGGLLFVRDLLRPETDAAVAVLVERWAARDTRRQRALFEASLRAGLRADEVAAAVAPLGIDPSSVRVTSDRHWTLAARR
jgi:hypothetical protein